MTLLTKIFKRKEPAAAELKGTPAAVVQAEGHVRVEHGRDDLSSSLVQAFQMLLEGMPLEADTAAEGGETRRAAMLRRLAGDLQPFSVLEVATDALTALEEDGRARQSRSEEQARKADAQKTQAALAGPALQALKAVIQALPAAGLNPAVDIVRRLDGTVSPGDLPEIADAALAVLQQDAAARLEESRQDHASLAPADQGAQLGAALSKSLQLVLGALPKLSAPQGEDESQISRSIPDLLRRLASPQSPLDIAAITNEALTALEQDVDVSNARQVAAAEELQTANAAHQALQILLAGLPLGSAPDSPESAGKRAMNSLLRRLEHPKSPAEVLEISEEALAALRRDASAGAAHNTAVKPQGAVQEASLTPLRSLLAALPLVNADDGRPDPVTANTVGSLLRRLESPPQPMELQVIVQEALAVVKRDCQAARERDRLLLKPPADVANAADSSKALLQALQMLLGNWPATGAAAQERKLAMDGLLRRLSEPLSPFDILDIATEALAALERESNATAESHQKMLRENVVKQDDLLDAYLKAFRILFEGMAAGAEEGTEAGTREQRAMTKLLRRLDTPLPPFAVVDLAEEAVKTLQYDIRGVIHRYSLDVEERQKIIALLITTIATLAPGRTSTISRLRQIEGQIGDTPTAIELRRLTSVLADCLQTMIQSSKSAATARPAPSSTASGEPAPEIGVPAPDAFEGYAESAAAEPATAPEPADYAAVFVLDRENGIAKRFGEGARQSVLHFVQHHLKEGLLPTDRLVRWKGAAFVASVKRVGTLPDVRAELTNLSVIGTPPVVEVDTRSISLPITLSWAVFPQAQFASIELLFKHVDQFIARTQAPGAGN